MIKAEKCLKNGKLGVYVCIDGDSKTIAIELYELMKSFESDTELLIMLGDVLKKILKEHENDTHNLSN